MKKILSILLVVTMLLGVFTGCGNSNDKTSKVQKTNEKISQKTNEKSNEEVVELKCYLEKWATNSQSMEAVIEAFEKEYPNIKISLEDTPDYETKVGILMTSGDPVDVLAVKNPVQFTKWVTAESLLALDELAAESGFDYEEAFGENKKAAMYEENYYMMPWQKTLWFLTYNKKIFDDAGVAYPSSTEPMTWSEYKVIAKKLTSGEGQDKVYGALNLAWPMYWYGQAIQSLGGGEKFYNEEGLSNIENPEFSKSLKFAYEMQNVDKSVPTYADIKTQKINAPAFMSGNYAMYPHGSWIFGWLKDKEKYPRDWQVGIAPMPIPDDADGSSTWGVYGGLAISKTAKYPKEAFTFIQYVAEKAPELGSSDLYAHKKAVDYNLPEKMSKGLEADGITAEMMEYILFNDKSKFVTEKITGKNSVKYETIAKEEVEKYFVDIQDLEITIKNIKERSDKIIQKD